MCCIIIKKAKGLFEMKKTLANFIRALLVFLIIASALMCKLWLPGAIFMVIGHLEQYAGIAGAEVSMAVCGLCAVVVLPVFVIFVMSFAFPGAIEKETIFSEKTAKLLKVIGVLLVADCALLCVMLTVLLALDASWLLVAPFIFTGVLGITVGCMLLVLSKYVKHAAALKEEADCTL
ncbi:MAG: DUF2975 domain-containing protein [Ruminococcaceae bacterium]|nr:DUF2975 domain-containing protein [Oscillospiraceae bacterium]